MTSPHIPSILMGVFPHAFEVTQKSNNEYDDRFVIKFDPKKFLIIPEAHWMMERLGYDIRSIRYNVDCQLIEVYV